MSVRYNRGKARIASEGWPNLSVKALVLAGSSVPAGAENPDLNTVSELLAVSGVAEAAEVGELTGYARKEVLGRTVTENDATDMADLKASSISYAATQSGTWRAVVFYVDGASDSARDLVALFTLPEPLVTNGGTVAINMPTDGPIGQG